MTPMKDSKACTGKCRSTQYLRVREILRHFMRNAATALELHIMPSFFGGRRPILDRDRRCNKIFRFVLICTSWQVQSLPRGQPGNEVKLQQLLRVGRKSRLFVGKHSSAHCRVAISRQILTAFGKDKFQSLVLCNPID